MRHGRRRRSPHAAAAPPRAAPAIPRPSRWPESAAPRRQSSPISSARSEKRRISCGRRRNTQHLGDHAERPERADERSSSSPPLRGRSNRRRTARRAPRSCRCRRRRMRAPRAGGAPRPGARPRAARARAARRRQRERRDADAAAASPIRMPVSTGAPARSSQAPVPSTARMKPIEPHSRIGP